MCTCTKFDIRNMLVRNGALPEGSPPAAYKTPEGAGISRACAQQESQPTRCPLAGVGAFNSWPARAMASASTVIASCRESPEATMTICMDSPAASRSWTAAISSNSAARIARLSPR